MPKTINVDTGLSSTASILYLTDAGTSSVVDAGDTVVLKFDEFVNLTAAMLPSNLFGTTVPTPTAVDGYKTTIDATLYAKEWTVTLATGTTLSSNLSSSFQLTAVMDSAGNTGNVSVTPGSTLLSNPRVKYIANVTSDNVVTAAEASAGVSININLVNANNTDSVKLYMDGKCIKTITLNTDSASGAVNFNAVTQVASVTLDASDWGATGARSLTAQIVRSTYNSAVSTGRTVYVNTDSAHWSSLIGATGLWFDPNSVAQDNGTRVTSLAASNRALSLSVDAGSLGALLMQNSINGNNALYFNGATGSTGSGRLTNSSSGLTAGVSDAKDVFLAFDSFDFGFALSEKGLYCIGGGSSSSAQQYLYSSTVGFSYLGTSGGTTSAPANVFAQTEFNFDAANSYYGRAFMNGSSVTMSNDKTVSFLSTAGSTTYNSLSLGTAQTTNKTIMNGLVGDLIVVDKVALTAAERGEINAYMAEKYRAIGITINTLGAASLQGHIVSLYDLSSRNDAVIVDQYYVNTSVDAVDTVLTSGADYVNTGAGDDQIFVKDLSFRQIEGGTGYDTLTLTSDFLGNTAWVLADNVSNARGIGASASDNTRVNAAGWHKLYGLEALDTSWALGKQVLTVAAADVNQLSESNTLAVTLGNNDVLLTAGSGFTSAVPDVGLWTVHGRYYDSLWSGTDSGQSVYLVAKSGLLPMGLKTGLAASNTTVTVVFDQTLLSSASVALGEFTLDSGTLSSVTLTTSANKLDLNLSSGFTGGVLGLTYSGSNLLSSDGVKVNYTKWYVGDASANTIDGSSEASAKMALFGNLSNDILKGGTKGDLIVGGAGNDTLTGNGGGDIFRWDAGDVGVDTVTDFNYAKSALGETGTADKLDLRALLSTSGLTADNLSTHLPTYVSLVQGGTSVVSSLSTTTSDAVMKVDTNADGTVEQTIVLQGQWSGLQGMTDVGGSAIGAGTPTSSQMLQELVSRGQLLVI